MFVFKIMVGPNEASSKTLALDNCFINIATLMLTLGVKLKAD